MKLFWRRAAKWFGGSRPFCRHSPHSSKMDNHF
jgi:hypothetical protein